MRYNNISLNGNKTWNYGLIKYNEDYKDYLKELKKMNKELADCIEECSRIYSESSEYQSYMIFRGNYRCVGAINIETSVDEKNLEIELQLFDKYFDNEQEIFDVIEQLVESLKLYFYDKENIEINLINNIDLSRTNSYKYKKKVYDENLTTYTCSNKRNNVLIPKLIEEIKTTEKNLINWGQSWWQNIREHELYHDFDIELMKKIDNGTITLEELLNKVKELEWTGINSTKSTRKINFSRDGKIELSKKSNNYNNGINYTFKYNVLNNNFNLKSHIGLTDEELEIDNNSLFNNMKKDGLNIMDIKETGKKRINYISQIENNSSISVEIWKNEKDDIEKCYIDFRTHKNNGKINGVYALRIVPDRTYNKFSIRFLSRKGVRYYDFSKDIMKNEHEFFSTIIDGKITVDLIDELVTKIIPIINNRADIYKKQHFEISNEPYVSNLADYEKQTIDFVKQIKGEIPLPHLQKDLEKFVTEYNENKVDSKKKLVKKIGGKI